MKEDLQDLIDLLHERKCSCVLRNGGIYTFVHRGVKDLYDLLRKQPGLLLGADVADKVVGKGAAALMALGRVRRIYADVFSEPAYGLLLQAGIPVFYGRLVPAIRNRAGNGLCPVETLCCDKETAEECLPLIAEFCEASASMK